ncbi:STAS domain-containing protein [Paenibacillus ginsengarvi]|uniref:Anti-sigma factor antagonist n=1 Tax=Paenibacillus ginsengarvi TaxID=400777 RepID=A0A3B0CFX5_9BACL|nr:STAS domain-containing protein [Paenibacillus ginsengarvi]RKN82016.1 anti-sigma factor antagonist [Paenibacillus ginsengarvi]
MLLTREDGIRVLWWNEDVTLKNVDDFRLAVRKLLDSEENSLVLELREVMYVNSGALGIIADAVRQGDRHRKQLVIAGIEPTVGEILSIVKFGAFIRLFRQREEAVAYIRSGPAT